MTEKDLTTIARFIRELAAFERLEEQVAVDERDLHEHLFGSRPYAEALIVERDEQPLGYAIFFHTFSTFQGKPGIYIEDLYVDQSVRRTGVGTELLTYVAQLAVDRECCRVQWSALDWNTAAHDFYRSFGADSSPEWLGFALSGEELRNLAQTSST